MDSVEVLRKAIEEWDGCAHASVPDRLFLIIQAVGLRVACGGYTASTTVEINDLLESLVEKASG